MRKNKKEVFSLCYIKEAGNWNFRTPDKKEVFGKSIAINSIDGDEFVWKHDEIIDLIKIHIQADEENITKINDPQVDTGEINFPEKTFLDKLNESLNNSPFNYKEWRPDLCEYCGEHNICSKCNKFTWSKHKLTNEVK